MTTDLVLWQRPEREELEACREALGNIEIHLFEAWEFETITKDAGRHFLAIADLCGWDMDWVAEIREWLS